jgi:prepilin-type N-terminal cleavage/methylation domain-containing protein
MFRNEPENNMMKFIKQPQQGFTLIETLIAIFLLTMAVGGLLTLAANGYFSVRYARNDITGNNLLQESLEYIRNSRDTAFQQNIPWQTWLNNYSQNKCTTSTGCIVDPYTNNSSQTVQACPDSGCPPITFYPVPGFYGYVTDSYPDIGQSGTTPYVTTYVRTVTMQQATDPNQLTVTVSVTWSNGNSKKTVSQSILLTNWSL